MSYLKLFAIGRLGKDVEDLRYTPTGTAIAEFSVATERMVKEKKHIEWLDVVAFGKVAEACKQYLAKGSRVFIEGTLKTDKWTVQPWATLLVIGAKKIETRSWATAYRGPLLIHASKKFTNNEAALCREWPFRGVRSSGASILSTASLPKCG